MLHDTLHRFRAGIGREGATLEAKMSQKLSGIAYEPLFQLFLYIRKAYDLLYWERCLELLRGYRLRPNLARILENYLQIQSIVPKLVQHLGTSFGTGRGVTQGYPASPMIFNILVDAVVRAVLDEV